MDLLRRYLRLLRIRLAARRGAPLGLHDVSRVPGRVGLTDIDELGHMNNGVYLSLLDHARLDLMERAGAWRRLQAAGVYPVVTGQTIAYRRSLTRGQRYIIESRIAGYGEKHVYIEQRFVVDGQIWERAFVEGRFLRRSGGVVPIEEVGVIVGEDVAAHPAPAWLVEWTARNALPSTREAAPSAWEGEPVVG
ncbi:thioesterase family protein [Pseudolysinimonas sp.]|uniref:thioesterase family protein n=1 Tax=Pseudolysinimonas sp. TaxID=2680009 RepID=UPI003F80D479